MAQIVERRRRAAGEAPPAQDPAAGAAPREKSREAVDPVCGMTVTVAGARHTAEVSGATYYFCCVGCRTKFLAEPARYAAAAAARP
jgi:YHS domain-containing protein